MHICLWCSNPPQHTHTHTQNAPLGLFSSTTPNWALKQMLFPGAGYRANFSALLRICSPIPPFHSLSFLLLSHCAKAQITDTDEQITGLKCSGSGIRRTQRWWAAANRSLKVMDATLFSLLLFNGSMQRLSLLHLCSHASSPASSITGSFNYL